MRNGVIDPSWLDEWTPLWKAILLPPPTQPTSREFPFVYNSRRDAAIAPASIELLRCVRRTITSRSGQRQSDMHLRALARFTLDFDTAAMRGRDSFGYGESQPAAFRFGTEERLERTLARVCVETSAGIPNGHGYGPCVGADADADCAIGLRGLNCVEQQVEEELLECCAVAFEGEMRIRQWRQLQRDSPANQFGLNGAYRCLDWLGQLHALQTHATGARNPQRPGNGGLQ